MSWTDVAEPGAWQRPNGQSLDGQLLDAASWDLLVIGGGTAGIVGAKTAAQLGATVLLVEQDRTGGDCLWTGCVPSKALLAAAHAAADARAAHRLGVHAGPVRVDFAAVRRHVQAAIAAIEPDDAPATLTAAGVRVVHGRARFTGQDHAEIILDDQQSVTVRFRQALIATGSGPALAPVPGLDGAGVVTSDTVWDLSELPARLLVLGAGSIGCELGQAFARLGSAVTLVEAGPRILPRESGDAASVVARALGSDGIDVRVGARVERVERHGDHLVLVMDDGDQVAGDVVLAATGRKPRTDALGLPAAGVSVTDHGFVQVDAALRTSNPRVYAAGDVTGHPQFTHVAGVHGSVAASNAVLGLRRHAETTVVPRVTFTQPEVAAFGVAPDAADGQGLQVRRTGHDRVDRAIADDDIDGFTDLVLDARGRIVGATIVGPRAGESLPELVLAARHGLRARDIAGAIHAYPTYADGPWKTAIEQVQDQLTGGAARRAVGALRGLQRRRRR